MIGRHSLALKAVLDKEAKRILEKSPPTKDLLFGDKVKESVQQIRDSLQIKRVLRSPYQKSSYPRKSPYAKVKRVICCIFNETSFFQPAGLYGQYGYHGQYRPGAATSGKARTPQRSAADRFKPATRGRFGRGRGKGGRKDDDEKDG